MGFLADILALIALYRFWADPLPAIWWWILGLLCANLIVVRVVKESLRLYGMKSSASIVWGIIATAIQLGLIALCVYSVVI